MTSRIPSLDYAVGDVSPEFALDLNSEFDDMFEFFETDEEIRRRKARRSPRVPRRPAGHSRTSTRPRRPPPARPRHPRNRRPRPQRRRPRTRRRRFLPPRYRHPVVIREPDAPCICPAHGTEFVRWVQSALNRFYGLRLPVNGVASAATRRAIRRFQKEKGLPVDGIAGPDTESALVESRPVARGLSAEPVQ
jgi:hypothetical protein